MSWGPYFNLFEKLGLIDLKQISCPLISKIFNKESNKP